MFKLFDVLNNKNKIWDFNGGIYPPEMKSQSSKIPIRISTLPEHFIVPVQQHMGAPAELRVKSGEKVLKGQPLTFGLGREVPVHAPTSGTITTIEPHITAHPSGLSELCVQIAADGHDIWCERYPQSDYHQQDPQQLLDRIHQAGIAGLGGAGFPTASKLSSGLNAINILIINAAECEPYITADDRLMQEYADDVVEGIRIIRHVLQPQQIIIGIEDNKPAAIAALKQALHNDSAILLRVIPTKYPSGGSRQLTKILTGIEIPHGKHASSVGVLMQNVGTTVAIKRAIIDGEPLIERVVTVTGEALSNPGNFWVRLGTPIDYLLMQAGFQPQPEPLVIMGGPLMGFTLPSLNAPIVKISNCILAPAATEVALSEPEQSCIRCGFCVDACPAGLLPQQLYWFSRGAEHEKARNYNLFDCIECGACAYVCPSNIPLVQYYRQEKAEIRSLDQESARSAEAKIRYEAKQARMKQEKQAREQRYTKKTINLADQNQQIMQTTVTHFIDQPHLAILDIAVKQGQHPDNQAVIAAQASTQQQEKTANMAENCSAKQPDPRKAAIAAAIARVKAKKATQTTKQE